MCKVISGNLQSKLMRRDIPYRVVLPRDYDTSIKKYPVLYLLHGLFGSCDNWLDLTEIREYAKSFGFVIVMVEGGNGWYSDSITVETEKFERYIIEELLPKISLKYHVDEKKRAIAGLSMGGYGAFKFGLKQPDLFSFVGSMSGAFVAPNRCEADKDERFYDLIPSISEVFGKNGSDARKANDIFQLIADISPKDVGSLPYLYFDCGIEDPFLQINQELANLLKEKNISFEFRQIDGKHDWDYWNQQLRFILLQAKRFLVNR